MGLTATAIGLDSETEYCCGYIIFGIYRIEIAKAYNEEFGILYEKWAKGIANEKDVEEMNHLNNDGLDLFLTHCDAEGKFTPKECRLIYNAMKDLKIDMQGHNYGVMKPYNMHEHWLNIFKHCYKRRVNLYFR